MHDECWNENGRNRLKESSVVKDYLTTASDGKNYNVTYYTPPMVLAVGFRVRSIRGNRIKNAEEAEKTIKWKRSWYFWGYCVIVPFFMWYKISFFLQNSITFTDSLL